MNYVTSPHAVFSSQAAPSTIRAISSAESYALLIEIDPTVDEPEEPSDLEEPDMPAINDADWEAFIADDDERDPQPEPGDFWIESEAAPRRDAA